MVRSIKAFVVAAGLAFSVLAHQNALADNTSFNDNARLLAGLPVDASSPLAKYNNDPYWKQHAQFFDAAWKKLNDGQLAKVRAWSDANLKDPQSTLFYFFSGPDYLYANAFFPKATTYILAGLEPVGPIPEFNDKTRGSLPNLRASLNTVLNLSFFITRHMQGQLTESQLIGTLPVLYVFITRAGNTIQDVTLVNLDKDGNAEAMPANSNQNRLTQANGVKIVFTSPEGVSHTLYYFRTDLANSGVKNSTFLQFADKFAPGDVFIKSASYLLHGDNFSTVREFLLDHARSVVQDDSGIPLRAFKPSEWTFYPFGVYVPPMAIFPGTNQPKLHELFLKEKAPKLEFGVGYRHGSNDSNLLLAVKNNVKATNGQ